VIALTLGAPGIWRREGEHARRSVVRAKPCDVMWTPSAALDHHAGERLGASGSEDYTTLQRTRPSSHRSTQSPGLLLGSVAGRSAGSNAGSASIESVRGDLPERVLRDAVLADEHLGGNFVYDGRSPAAGQGVAGRYGRATPSKGPPDLRIIRPRAPVVGSQAVHRSIDVARLPLRPTIARAA